MEPTFLRQVPRPIEGRGSTTPDLVDRLVAGEDAAYKDLLHLHGPRLLAVATRYLGNATDAADAVQDTLVCVVRSIGRFQRESSLQTWLHRIVVNCSLMQLRRRKRKPSAPLAESMLETGAGPEVRVRTAHQELAARELGSIVHAAIDLLPAEQRTVLLLRDVEELGLADIAALLQLRVSTVKWRLLGAHRALRIALRPQLEDRHDRLP